MEHCGAKFVNKLGLGTEESDWIFIFYFTYRDYNAYWAVWNGLVQIQK